MKQPAERSSADRAETVPPVLLIPEHLFLVSSGGCGKIYMKTAKWSECFYQLFQVANASQKTYNENIFESKRKEFSISEECAGTGGTM